MKHESREQVGDDLDDINGEWPHRIAHVCFLREELMAIVRKNKFVSRFRAKIGYEVWQTAFDAKAINIDPSYSNDADYLFYWIEKEGGIWTRLLSDKDEQYFDDDGEQYVQPVPESIPGSLQMAAYGLFLMQHSFHDRDYLEFSRESLTNWQGATKEAAIVDQAAVMLEGYKSLVYAQKIQLGGALTEAEEAKSKTYNFAKLGSQGGKKRHEANAKLQQWTIDKYLAGSWPSISQAALDLQDSVMAHGRTIGAHLSPSNAQRLIQSWISRNKNNTA